MIGNDIIDLEAAKKESNWRRNGYLEKIFTPKEQELILTSLTPDVMVWVLWSMKEAVYKAEFRRTLKYEYAPLKVRCLRMEESDSSLRAILIYNEIEYFANTKIFSDSLHTIACRWKDDFSSLKSIEIENYSNNYLLDLRKNNLISDKEWIIKNNFGIPNLIDFKKDKVYPLSISHHGRFFAAVSAPFYAF